MTIRTINDVDFAHKKVLLRADIDVPLLHRRQEGGEGRKLGSFTTEITDDFRLLRMLPTIDYLLKMQARLIIIGDINRPNGKIIEEDRVAPIVEWFSKRYKEVKYSRSITGMEPRQAALGLSDGEILFLENLRFDIGEETNRESFAKELASYGQAYVNECFATSHRNHASFAAVPKFLPSYAGFNLISEIENLSQVILHPRRPLLVIIGGSKLETKIPVIDRILTLADKVLITGKVGAEISKLPHYGSQKLIYSVGEPDILPDELERFASLISIAGTIIWNGPAGDTSKGYTDGTRQLAEMIAGSAAKTVVGGGDTNAVLTKFNLRDKFSFVSTGGGSMLDFLAGKELPGIKSLLVA